MISLGKSPIVFLLSTGISCCLGACTTGTEADKSPINGADSNKTETDTPNSRETDTDTATGTAVEPNTTDDTGSETGPQDSDPQGDASVDTDTLDTSQPDSSDGDSVSTETETTTETESDTESDSEDSVQDVVRTCDQECLDFPAYPMIEGEVPPLSVSYLTDNPRFESPGPCVVEPQLSSGDTPGALFPANWLRPRFRFIPAEDHDVYEIRLRTDRQKYDLVVYTTETTWTMPQDIWKGLTSSAIDEEVTVIIRTIDSVNPSTPRGTIGTFSIAPVRAEGKLVYWATTSSNVDPNTSKLAGFAVGESGVVDVLTISDVGDRDILSTDGRQERSPSYGVEEGCVQCIGCHVATPDGEAVAFGDHWPWNVVVASIKDPETTSVGLGKAPAYLTKGAEILLNQPWLGMPTFSKAIWSNDQRILVTSYGERITESGETVGFTHNTPTHDVLAWFDLMTAANLEIADDYIGDALPERNRLVEESLDIGFGFVSLIGETLSAVSPNWSNDGTRIAYTAASKTVDGRLGGGVSQTDVDIHIVPYNDGLGGTVTELQGANEKEVAEYYPSFSPDDTLIVFNREEDFRAEKTVTTFFYPPYDNIKIDGSATAIYYRPHAEVYVIPSEGGTPMRLIANDPPQCTQETSPGVINSWGKWAPEVKMSSEDFGPKRSYYWVVFSSARDYPEQFIVERNSYSPPDTRSSQLYLAAVVRNEETGEYTNYPAIYLWNQDKETSNLTPAWDNFKIPSANGQ